MTDSLRSQKGGESNLRGIDYQKKFTAFLCVRMLKEDKIKEVTCEHLDDVEVQEVSKLVYYQIKSTSGNVLSKSEILDSFGLFLSNDGRVKERPANREYVLVSNGIIRKFSDILVSMASIKAIWIVRKFFFNLEHISAEIKFSFQYFIYKNCH